MKIRSLVTTLVIVLGCMTVSIKADANILDLQFGNADLGFKSKGTANNCDCKKLQKQLNRCRCTGIGAGVGPLFLGVPGNDKDCDECNSIQYQQTQCRCTQQSTTPQSSSSSTKTR